MTELLPCPFERGQVWKNPDDMLMLITSVRQTVDSSKIEYIDEDGGIGSFYASDNVITDNIELVSNRATQPVDVEALKRECLENIQRHSVGYVDWQRANAAIQAIDHLAANYDFVPKKASGG